MSAIRVLIGCVYANTKSVPIARLLHASSTGSLGMLSPPRVNARQEVVWYLVYAAALWVTVGLIGGALTAGLGVSKAGWVQADRLCESLPPLVPVRTTLVFLAGALTAFEISAYLTVCMGSVPRVLALRPVLFSD